MSFIWKLHSEILLQIKEQLKPWNYMMLKKNKNKNNKHLLVNCEGVFLKYQKVWSKTWNTLWKVSW